MGLTRRPHATLVAGATVVALMATACSSGGSSGGNAGITPATAAATPGSNTSPAVASSTGSIVLIAGTVPIAAARSFDDPGFHQTVEIGGTISIQLPKSSTARLTVSLWDASRPTQTCARDHPLSGCVTVDWSDAPGRPHVPDSGVFLNQLTLLSASGPSTFNLSESGMLSPAPDKFSPG